MADVIFSVKNKQLQKPWQKMLLNTSPTQGQSMLQDLSSSVFQIHLQTETKVNWFIFTYITTV